MFGRVEVARGAGRNAAAKFARAHEFQEDFWNSEAAGLGVLDIFFEMGGDLIAAFAFGKVGRHHRVEGRLQGSEPGEGAVERHGFLGPATERESFPPRLFAAPCNGQGGESFINAVHWLNDVSELAGGRPIQSAHD